MIENLIVFGYIVIFVLVVVLFCVFIRLILAVTTAVEVHSARLARKPLEKQTTVTQTSVSDIQARCSEDTVSSKRRTISQPRDLKPEEIAPTLINPPKVAGGFGSKVSKT